ncbi:cyclic peptide export ABC transporter [Pedobacter alluvionis]|uniref:Cyclic peptide export ABC transporter n=1 Tax=Pedobacter alluvionis TaxID=475253 RepID=A0A497XYZ6_9SPHI|nr:cyclic peptide export ABC transporter [Pedobacter alluvionis]RLJ72735.1 putative ATP-binding cassette transporter [Pedobacter alluvionis]TFB29425.1 cyclic peptide export ABC transporter [Pedobacter alluvionis]
MKKLIKLLLPQIGKIGLLKYIFLAIFSGLCSFLFINTVTRVIGLIISGGFTNISREYILIFAAIIIGFIWVRRTLSLAIINLSQKLFWHLRSDVLSLVLRANYQQLSSKRMEIHAAMVSDINILTNVSMSVIDFCAAIILSISCLLYLLSISGVLFLITLGVAASGAIVYHLNSKSNLTDFNKARMLETDFQKNFNAILDGFKEIFMEPKKGRFIYEKKIQHIADEAQGNNTKAFTGFLNNQITGQVLFYILISSVLLFFSITLKIKSGDTISFVFTLLYLLGSVETIMVLLPGILRAGVASNHLMALKTELENAEFNAAIPVSYYSKADFYSISVKGLEFQYNKKNAEDAFSIGPVDMEINKGEVTFIYGGNGSGKTTFIHAVLGLRYPSSGEIQLNGQVVDQKCYADYRTLFSTVFSDFYLFDQIIGIDHIDLEKWKAYIDLFEIADKVSLTDGKLSTTDLSAGQRKRLALIVALLENKPILVLDEWAADQDPYFRKRFYTEIIPMLKNDGLTIIAITHDDKYYHCADSLYKMDEGKLIVEKAEPGLINIIS